MPAISVQGSDIKWGAAVGSLADIVQATGITVTLPPPETAESTDLNSVASERVFVINGFWEIKFDLHLNTGDAQHTALLAECVAAAKALMTFRVAATSGLGTYTGTGFLQGGDVALQLKQLGKASFTVLGTGPLTYAA